jgi:pSer/pThr/pTyr-binding forkhead associated (FHA) protein
MTLWLQLGHERFPIRQGEITLGRSRYCTVIVDNATTSRQHAAIRVQGDVVTLYDLGSRNGTLVNGERISAPTQLKLGDVLGIGSDSCSLVESTVADDSTRTAERDAPADLRANVQTLPDR